MARERSAVTVKIKIRDKRSHQRARFDYTHYIGETMRTLDCTDLNARYLSCLEVANDDCLIGRFDKRQPIRFRYGIFLRFVNASSSSVYQRGCVARVYY